MISMPRSSPGLITSHISRHTRARSVLNVTLIPPFKVILSTPRFNDLHNVIVVPTSNSKRLLEPSRQKRSVGSRLSHHACTRGLLEAEGLGELWLWVDH